MSVTATQAGLDGRQLRELMGHFPTGVAIVTVAHDGSWYGMTVNSLTSVSLEPPLILVCLLRGTRTACAVRARGAFAVNILASSQDALARRFARPGSEDRYAGLQTRVGPGGLPLLPALAHLCCEVREVRDGGDHEIFIAEVHSGDACERSPLVFHRGCFHGLAEDGREAGWYW